MSGCILNAGGPGAVTDLTATDRDRIGDYVRRALSREIAVREITWEHSLDWNETAIRLTLTRGELAITRAVAVGGAPKDANAAAAEPGPWWTPGDGVWPKELTRRLVHIVWLSWLHFRDADETGRLHVTVWRDRVGDRRYLVIPRPAVEEVRLVLEPGLLVERADFSERAPVRRLFSQEAETVGEALGWSWAPVETL